MHACDVNDARTFCGYTAVLGCRATGGGAVQAGSVVQHWRLRGVGSLWVPSTATRAHQGCAQSCAAFGDMALHGRATVRPQTTAVILKRGGSCSLKVRGPSTSCVHSIGAV